MRSPYLLGSREFGFSTGKQESSSRGVESHMALTLNNDAD